jgi:hypothetical protein
MKSMPPPASGRTVGVALGVSVACLAYSGSLVLQVCVPSAGDFLSVDLGNGVRATYYLRGVCSVAAGMLVALIAAVATTRRVHVSERSIARLTAVAVALSALLIVMFP